MKTYVFLAAAALAGLTGCSGPRQASTGAYDDVYYVKPEPAAQAPATQPGDYSSAQADPNGNSRFEYTDDGTGSTASQSRGTTYVTNNYYDSDDYYDYAYTARLRRFYHPYGWGYYDSYYTNQVPY